MRETDAEAMHRPPSDGICVLRVRAGKGSENLYIFPPFYFSLHVYLGERRSDSPFQAKDQAQKGGMRYTANIYEQSCI